MDGLNANTKPACNVNAKYCDEFSVKLKCIVTSLSCVQLGINAHNATSEHCWPANKTAKLEWCQDFGKINKTYDLCTKALNGSLRNYEASNSNRISSRSTSFYRGSPKSWGIVNFFLFAQIDNIFYLSVVMVNEIYSSSWVTRGEERRNIDRRHASELIQMVIRLLYFIFRILNKFDANLILSPQESQHFCYYIVRKHSHNSHELVMLARLICVVCILSFHLNVC